MHVGRCVPPLFCRIRGAVGKKKGRLKSLSPRRMSGIEIDRGIHDALAASAAIVAAISASKAAADPEPALEAYATERSRVARELLIPRTDGNITAGSARLAQMRALAADSAGLRAYLSRASMLDMVAPPYDSLSAPHHRSPNHALA